MRWGTVCSAIVMPTQHARAVLTQPCMQLMQRASLKGKVCTTACSSCTTAYLLARVSASAYVRRLLWWHDTLPNSTSVPDNL